MRDKDKAKEQLIKELEGFRERIAELEEEVVDPLTGLHSRCHFFSLAEHEFARSYRYERSLSALMLDIDNFEDINETYGHAVGEQVLRVVAERCKMNVRSVDVVGRYRDEEFVLLLPEANLEAAKKVAERVRQSVARAPVSTERGSVVTTISLGVANISEGTPNLVALLERASKALHFAKQDGGDCIETR